RISNAVSRQKDKQISLRDRWDINVDTQLPYSNVWEFLYNPLHFQRICGILIMGNAVLCMIPHLIDKEMRSIDS
ncbi:MAG TPA: hypothetical protein DCP68_09140, partial [Ruminococcus sp.]|nr:hypothetical protein [Ruminococcus sp.]